MEQSGGYSKRPSVTRKNLLEKRMEMLALLLTRGMKEGNEKQAVNDSIHRS